MTEKSGVCIRQTEIPSSTGLFTDFLYHFDRVSSFYRYPPQLSAAPAAAREIAIDPERRDALVEALRRQNAASGAATADHLDLLAKPETVVVATGQQVGLYGGPVFTLYKALTALKFAEELRASGTPAVAVFWLATEDHDLAEVDHAWVFNRDNEPVRLEAAAESSPSQPVGSVMVKDAASERLREALAEFPFGEEVEERARAAYPSNISFQAGFAHLLQGLLERYGLIFLDPMDAAIRRLSAPLFRRAIAEAPAINSDLIGRAERLEQAGYHTQVRVTPETSLLLLIDQGRRTVLRRSESSYSTDDATYSTEDLLERLDASPEQFSPNALLRPVTQDFLLPTVVYVGGPAELAYLAQAEVLYSRLLGRMPVIVPRASFTILDSRAERLFQRYGLALTDCFEGPENLRRKIAERLIPPNLERTLAAAESQVTSALDAVSRDLKEFDPTLNSSLEKTTQKILYQFQKIRGKAAQESFRRDERAGRDAGYLSHLIFPDKVLQERLYSVLPFLARHGFDFIDRVYGAIHPECRDHQVWVA